MTDEAQDVYRGTKDSLKVQALAQRLAQIVAQYEEQSAEFRADATVQVEVLTQRVQALTEEIQRLHAEKDANEVPQGTPSITE